MKAAQGNGKLPLAFFDAQCATVEEARERQYEVNADRSEAAILARKGW